MLTEHVFWFILPPLPYWVSHWLSLFLHKSHTVPLIYPNETFHTFQMFLLRIRLRIFETDVYTHTYTKLHQRQRRPQTVGEITHVLFSLPAGTLPYRKKKPATMLEHWAVLSSEWVKCCMLNAKEQWWHKIGHLWNHRLQIVQSMTTEKIFSDHARQNLSDTTTRLDLSQWH